MARRELGAAALRVAQAVASALPGECVVGCSGGPDSLALALGAQWAGRRAGVAVRVLIIDHQLQPGSAQQARQVQRQLRERQLAAEVVPVQVIPDGEGLEAAARHARYAALSSPGLPVLLGHTLDDQAETVLLGLLRGSGARSLAGMAPVRGQFIRPLLGVRRAETAAACQDWGITPWHDPMNTDVAFARVRARRLLGLVAEELGRDVAPSLARTAELLRADADALDALVPQQLPYLVAAELAGWPDALRRRAVHRFLTQHGVLPTQPQVAAVDALLVSWRGQGPVAVTGGWVRRVAGRIGFEPSR